MALMTYARFLLLLFLFLAVLSPRASSTRSLLPAATTTSTHTPAALPLHQRLSASFGSLARTGAGESADCWNALLQLKSCAGEMVLFFLNGETYLGPSCCTAIQIVTQKCWPGMLAVVGLTAQEGDVLQGYCDAAEVDQHPPPPAPPASGGAASPPPLVGL